MKKSVKISEPVNRRRTDKTVTKRIRTKGQTMIYKALHRKLKRNTNKSYVYDFLPPSHDRGFSDQFVTSGSHGISLKTC